MDSGLGKTWTISVDGVLLVVTVKEITINIGSFSGNWKFGARNFAAQFFPGSNHGALLPNLVGRTAAHAKVLSVKLLGRCNMICAVNPTVIVTT